MKYWSARQDRLAKEFQEKRINYFLNQLEELCNTHEIMIDTNDSTFLTVFEPDIKTLSGRYVNVSGKLVLIKFDNSYDDIFNRVRCFEREFRFNYDHRHEFWKTLSYQRVSAGYKDPKMNSHDTRLPLLLQKYDLNVSARIESANKSCDNIYFYLNFDR